MSLRHELAERAHKYAISHQKPFALSYGEMPVVCFPSHADESTHGNFMRESYRTILANPDWQKRLGKVHTQARRSMPSREHGRWRELDSCMSSDALLMNIFCHPRVSRDGAAFAFLGAEVDALPCFGYKARVPLANGRLDRTEVDLRLGNLLIEAKLTENDFQQAEKSVLLRYRDFHDVFDHDQLPQTEGHYLSYQLLRNVLAANALHCSFRVLLDERRPDLIEAWYSVMRCVKPAELRTTLGVLTWQELARVLPPKVRIFLSSKYGIA
ncbi:MAG: hypothetical protein WB421_04345 [Terriglobales bacterium]